jgi:CBS domain-containing protein
VADILDRHRIRRVPVIQAGRLAGIITRGDLVRTLSQVQRVCTVFHRRHLVRNADPATPLIDLYQHRFAAHMVDS